MKRAFDILVALAALLAASPLLLLAAVGIRLSSPGPVLYHAKRVGKGGRPYGMYKFRTMHVREEQGSEITAPGDARVFPFARFLRKTKIDELPQLINVLRGEMAIVGPRPEAVSIVERHYTGWMRETLTVPPGLTSPGSIFYYTHSDRLLDPRDPEGSYVEWVIAPKLAIDRAYLERANLWRDMGVMLRTAVIIVAIALGKKVFPLPAEARRADAWYDFSRLRPDLAAPSQ